MGNDYYESNRAKAKLLRQKIKQEQDSIPLGGKGYRKQDAGILPPDYKSNASAFDAMQNMREQEAEMYEQRAKNAKSRRK